MIHLLFALLLLQPLPEPPATTFTPTCYTLVDEAFTVYIGYTSNAERHFVGDGLDFVTQAGTYPHALAIAAGYLPAPDVARVAFTELVSTGDPALDAVTGGTGEMVSIDIDWSMLGECGHETEVPNPLPTAPPNNEPMPIDCDTWALDGATGEPYCYTPDASGIIPLPPAYQ